MKSIKEVSVNMPDVIPTSEDIKFECEICLDKHWIDYETYEDTISANGDILINDKKKIVDGELIVEIFYRQRCTCFIDKRNKNNFDNRISESGLTTLLETNTFKKFEITQNWQQEMKDLCVRFVKHPAGLLALLGSTGTGKTHLGTATTGNLAHMGYKVLYVEWKKEMSKAKSNYYHVNNETLELWKTVEVLYIDDLFKSRNNDYSNIPAFEFDTAWSIIDVRCKRNLITIISSEFTLAELYEMDQSLAGRINQYSNGYMFNIARDEKKNYRMRDAL